MTTSMLLAPVGAGKTARVLEQITQTLNTQPFARVWCVLATKRQEDAFRQRLIDWDTGKRIFFNVEFFNFYELYGYLLDMSGNPQRQLSESARYALLKTVIADLRDDLEAFGAISHTPGFLRIVADFIYELKQNQIYPEDFEQFAHGDEGTAKDRDLAQIYGRYQAQLQAYNLVDKEGQGWLAVEALLNDADLAADIALFVVDGFDQFTPVQAYLVALLADRSGQGLITMTHVPDREATVGRRFERAMARLTERFEHLPVEKVRDIAGVRHDDLHHLIEQVFRRAPLTKPLSGGVNLAEVPSMVDEVGVVLRQVKQLLLDGVSADDILIVLRDWERYRSHFLTFRDKYQLPLVLHYGESLEENPAVHALLTLLTLHEDNFRRRDLLGVLRSPYFNWPTLTADAVNLLDQISQQHNVIGGRDAWLDAIRQASIAHTDEEGEVHDGLLNQQAADQLQADLDDFFAIITPPDNATVSEYIYWIDSLLGDDPNAETEDINDDESTPPGSLTLNVIRCVRADNAPDEIIARDVLALDQFKQVLRSLLTAQDLLRSLDSAQEAVTDWVNFSVDLLSAVGSAAVNARPARYGRVLVTTAADARGLPHAHVFILGLSEGIFPASVPEDPLYLDSERRRMLISGSQLETQAERAADDGLFYELICLPRESLTLTRPTMQEGKVWMPSPLWRAVTRVFSDADAIIKQQSIRIGQVIPLEYVASLDEFAIAAADRLSQPEPLSDAQSGFVAWLQQAQAQYWQHVEQGRRIELGRLSTEPHNRYSGRLENERLIELVREKLGAQRVWSASQFNDYGVCGFRFFAKRLLKLESIEEPEEGMNAAQNGSLNHSILERTYGRIKARDLTLVPENLDTALNIFYEEAQRVFSNAPADIGFRESALWEQEKPVILRKLEQMIRADFSGSSQVDKKFGEVARKPFMLEAPFGVGRDSVRVEIDLGADVGKVRVRGFIDRIDEQGDSLIVIDYKTGGTKIPTKEMEAGRNFQMLVYLEGVQALIMREKINKQLMGGAFWHISNQAVSGDIRLDADGPGAINRAKNHLSRHIALGRRGDFAVHASKPEEGRCVRYCEFAQMCRMSGTNRWKKN